MFYKKIIYSFFVCFIIWGLYYYRFQSDKKYRILVLWTGAGEQEWAKRLEVVCYNLKWECKTAFCPQRLSHLEELIIDDYSKSANQIAQEFVPDLVISLNKRCQQISLTTKNYLAISGDSKKVFDVTCESPEEFLAFDGFLSSSPFVEKIRELVESSGKRFHVIDWYPSCQATQYEETIPKKLFYCGFQWDKKRSGKEYQKMFSLLDQQGYFEVYGPPERWDCAPNSRKGYLPFDGGKSLSNVLRKSGIALILQAQSHIDLQAPTGRIFEAAASCCVIISDKNPFIMREFGESVLYVDGDLDGEKLFIEIDNHMKWILSHPQEAQKMAQKAHTSFLEKFTLEQQLKKLVQLHEIVNSNH